MRQVKTYIEYYQVSAAVNAWQTSDPFQVLSVLLCSQYVLYTPRFLGLLVSQCLALYIMQTTISIFIRLWPLSWPHDPCCYISPISPVSLELFLQVLCPWGWFYLWIFWIFTSCISCTGILLFCMCDTCPLCCHICVIFFYFSLSSCLIV